jgi:uncharacterized protein YegJ (DUF2314 family)
MTYTTEQVTKYVKAARDRHKGRVAESERQYIDDVRYAQKQCPHEVTDIKHIIDVIKFQMRTVEAVASAIQADPSIYQSIDKDRLALVMNGDWALEDVLYVFRMCKLKFKVEVTDGSYFDEWY